MENIKDLVEHINHYAKEHEFGTSEIRAIDLNQASDLQSEYEIPGILVEYNNQIGFVISKNQDNIIVYDAIEGIERKLTKEEINKAKVIGSDSVGTNNWETIQKFQGKLLVPNMIPMKKYSSDSGLMSIVGLHLANEANQEYDGGKFIQHYSARVNSLLRK